MNYSVILVQQGISAQSHPVNGKSGKLYGTAVASPEHGGVIFQMTMHDYLENAHDVVGNLQPSQQWVPEFVPLAPKAGHQKCDRKPSSPSCRNKQKSWALIPSGKTKRNCARRLRPNKNRRHHKSLTSIAL
jgi:hypothetical protein